MNESLRVVAALISDNSGRILLTQRKREAEFGWCWETPGGKVEAGESDFEAISRELKEEIGCEVFSMDQIPLFEDTFSPPLCKVQCTIIHYKVTLKVGSIPKTLESEGLGWFTPEELQGLSTTPSLEIHKKDLLRKSYSFWRKTVDAFSIAGFFSKLLAWAPLFIGNITVNEWRDRKKPKTVLGGVYKRELPNAPPPMGTGITFQEVTKPSIVSAEFIEALRQSGARSSLVDELVKERDKELKKDVS